MVGMDIALARSELERLRRAACTMITGAMRTIPTKVLEMLLDLPKLGTVVETAALMAYHLPRTDLRNLGIGQNRIWAKADEVDGMTQDHVTLRRTVSKYRIAILTREEWGKKHSVEKDYRQACEGGSRDQIYWSGALPTTILEQI